MNHLSLFIIFVFILSIILLLINFIFAFHNPYKEKRSPFECGYHSFLQNRSQFSISFFIFALLFLIFDIEIVLIYPFTVSSCVVGIYGFFATIGFIVILTLGLIFEIGKKALTIYTKQENTLDAPVNRFYSFATNPLVSMPVLSEKLIKCLEKKKMVFYFIRTILTLLVLFIVDSVYNSSIDFCIPDETNPEQATTNMFDPNRQVPNIPLAEFSGAEPITYGRYFSIPYFHADLHEYFVYLNSHRFWNYTDVEIEWIGKYKRGIIEELFTINDRPTLNRFRARYEQYHGTRFFEEFYGNNRWWIREQTLATIRQRRGLLPLGDNN